MEPVRWGVLSTAKIAVAKVVPAMRSARHAQVAAIASQDIGRARAAAASLGIPKAYGSYEELLADPSIEAIYNPLPNHLHVPWTVKALEAGKHVLCEKPIALTAPEAETLIAAEARTRRRVAEAFMVRHHPQWQRVCELVAAAAIGDVRLIRTIFAYHLTDPGNIRNQPGIGGGGLYDIGCYAIATARFVFGAEPSRVVAAVERDPHLQVDRLTSGLIEFPGGRHLVFSCATQLAPRQHVELLGDRGRIGIDVPFNPDPTRPTAIAIDDGRDLIGGGLTHETFPACDAYTLQADAFSTAIRSGAPFAHPIADAVANMRIIDALWRSEASGRWEKP